MFAQLRKIPVSVLLAIMGIIMASGYMVRSLQPEEKPLPHREPAASPYQQTIAGVGIVESDEENIEVAPFWPGKVVQVYVQEGQQVQPGDPLFRLDARDIDAQIQSREADVLVQQSALQRMRHEPRSEDLAPLRAEIELAKSNLADAQQQLNRFESISDPRAITQDELTRKRYAVDSAKAQLLKAQANYQRVAAGAWIYDIRQAEAKLKASVAAIQQLKVQRDQATIRAMLPSQVLQVNLRPGEFIATQSNPSAVVLGQTNRLQVRVDIDEINASQVLPNMRAKATLKGEADRSFPLRFVRIEPYMVPKRNLTGASSERVDVRVLQLIYDFAPPTFPVYVGQQVDVFLEQTAGRAGGKSA
ncbi:MAG: biotin/lipoyl-binding protein [Candidatus Melainabacteria bacterium]|nr:biotin/lipoyl-binding protein [Candidatus Melainabacteria bacterium]